MTGDEGKCLRARFPGGTRGLYQILSIGAGFFPGRTPAPTNLVECMGLWDTGASGSVITKKLADQLGLKPISATEVCHAGGRGHANVYQVCLVLPPGIGFPSLRVTEGDLGDMESLHVLIGMDVISQGDFTITNHGGMTEVHYQRPSTGLGALGKRIENWDAAPHANFAAPNLVTPVPPVVPTPSVQLKPVPIVRSTRKIGRNEPCPCGSGLKYKRCCGAG